MTILIFILVLALLIFVHELGHFLVAKFFKVRVDEFALGFPPRLFGFKYKETDYVLNLIPFGGYVKIFGENPDEESINGIDSERSLVKKPKRVQAAVLLAGVTFNMILAWLLFSLGFVLGFPVSGDFLTKFPEAEKQVIITDVISGSSAFEEGVEVGMNLVYAINPETNEKLVISKTQDLQALVANNPSDKVILGVKDGSGEEVSEIELLARDDLSGLEGRKALGVGLGEVGLVKLPWYKAPLAGLILTYDTTKMMFIGLADLVVKLSEGLSLKETVVGPVGIAGMVGDAHSLGFVYLLSFTAFISINLAILNLVPFPALDGGRLFFLLIEAIKGSPINPKISNTVNLIGFLLLLLLMIYVTWGDIVRLF